MTGTWTCLGLHKYAMSRVVKKIYVVANRTGRCWQFAFALVDSYGEHSSSIGRSGDANDRPTMAFNEPNTFSVTTGITASHANAICVTSVNGTQYLPMYLNEGVTLYVGQPHQESQRKALCEE